MTRRARKPSEPVTNRPVVDARLLEGIVNLRRPSAFGHCQARVRWRLEVSPSVL
jgi:hypothetical protein